MRRFRELGLPFSHDWDRSRFAFELIKCVAVPQTPGEVGFLPADVAEENASSTARIFANECPAGVGKPVTIDAVAENPFAIIEPVREPIGMIRHGRIGVVVGFHFADQSPSNARSAFLSAAMVLAIFRSQHESLDICFSDHYAGQSQRTRRSQQTDQQQQLDG